MDMGAIGLRHFTLEQYHQMAAAGILAEDDRVELIHGVVREMSPKSRRHVIATMKIRELFARGLVGRAGVYEEKPLQLQALDSEPEPDVAVCSNPDFRAYGTDRTEPLLVVEVADSSLRDDLGIKAELYARAKIPEYWVVDLVHGVLVVFREPRKGEYQEHSTHERATRIAPLSWPDFMIDVGTLFPQEEAPPC